MPHTAHPEPASEPYLLDIEHDTALLLESGLGPDDELVAEYIAILTAHGVPTPAPGRWEYCPIRGRRFTYTSALAGAGPDQEGP